MSDKFYGMLFGEKFPKNERTAFAVAHRLLSGGDLLGAAVTPETLAEFIKRKEFDGLIVSGEFGKTVMPLLSKTSPAARAVGSADVIVKTADGKLYGDNTSIYAFSHLISRLFPDPFIRKCLILGDGPDAAAARHVISSLTKNSAEIISVKEKGKNNFSNIYLHADAELLINTLGDFAELPFSLDALPCLSAIIDTSFSPLSSRLVLEARARGILATNGIPLAAARVLAANELFFSVESEYDILPTVEASIFSSLMNITLISNDESLAKAVAPMLSDAIGKKSYDLGDIFEGLYKKSLAELKAMSGPHSNEFDRMLRVAVEWMKKRNGCIICAPAELSEKNKYRASVASGGPVIGIVTPDDEAIALGSFCDILVQINDASQAEIAVEAIRAELQI